jgi:hypothetical protein
MADVPVMTGTSLLLLSSFTRQGEKKFKIPSALVFSLKTVTNYLTLTQAFFQKN